MFVWSTHKEELHKEKHYFQVSPQSKEIRKAMIEALLEVVKLMVLLGVAWNIIPR